MRTVVIGLVVLVLTSPALAKRVNGEWTDAYAGRNGKLKFVGKFDVNAGIVKGKIKCRGCPVKGPFNPTCTGSSSSWNCTGPAGPAGNGCTASGYLYPTVFEGTWDCGPFTGGVLSFGHR
jgi:hypothetical protein